MTRVTLSCGCETTRTDPQNFDTLVCPDHGVVSFCIGGESATDEYGNE